MHILLTRPKRDGEDLAARLAALGHRVTLAPLITIALEPIPLAAIEDAAALIATSRNALKALAQSPALAFARTLPLFVVGPGTAKAAREMGFKDVIEGSGEAAGLVSIVADKAKADGGLFVYLAGNIRAFDLNAALARENVPLRSVAAYRAVAAESLPAEVEGLLQNRAIDAVILLSPRTADTWGRLASGIVPSSDLAGVTHLCLSKAVASALTARLPVKDVLTAAAPNIEEMLTLVKRLAAGSKAE